MSFNEQRTQTISYLKILVHKFEYERDERLLMYSFLVLCV